MNGEPVGLLKVARELVSDTPITKGVIAIRSPSRGRTAPKATAARAEPSAV